MWVRGLWGVEAQGEGYSVDWRCRCRYGACARGTGICVCVMIEWCRGAYVPDGWRVWCGGGIKGEKGYCECLMETSSGRRARREDDRGGCRGSSSAFSVPCRRGARAGCCRGIGEEERGYVSRRRCQWRLSHLWRWVEASIQTADVSRWGGCGIIPTRPVASSIARRSTEENDKSRLLLRPTYLHLLVEERLSVGGKLKQTSTRTTLDNPRAHVSCERRCCNVSPESARLQAEDAGRVAVNDEFQAHRRRR